MSFIFLRSLLYIYRGRACEFSISPVLHASPSVFLLQNILLPSCKDSSCKYSRKHALLIYLSSWYLRVKKTLLRRFPLLSFLCSMSFFSSHFLPVFLCPPLPAPFLLCPPLPFAAHTERALWNSSFFLCVRNRTTTDCPSNINPVLNCLHHPIPSVQHERFSNYCLSCSVTVTH
jgi:hypothetical protein